MRDKPRRYPITWRKPPLEGPPIKATRPPIHVFEDGESSRFFGLVVFIVAATPVLLLLLHILDGRWWRGDISGGLALCLGLPVFVAYLIAIGWAWWLHRKGKARADALKIRRVDAPEIEFHEVTTPFMLIKWTAALILPILFEVFLWQGLKRLLAGLPFSDTTPHQHYYRRYRNEILDKYVAPHFPVGPIFTIVMMLFTAALTVFLVWGIVRETRKLVRKYRA